MIVQRTIAAQKTSFVFQNKTRHEGEQMKTSPETRCIMMYRNTSASESRDWKSSTRLQRQIPGLRKAHRSCSLIRRISFSYNIFSGSLLHVTLQCRRKRPSFHATERQKSNKQGCWRSFPLLCYCGAPKLNPFFDYTGKGNRNSGRFPLTASL